ncbi:hypothetical protein ASF53_05115 [Methylobacterium sp. Leaf123]|uniref:hypothetical protein n=1 Tax=Methylobacterium sp. Leaf123 TaxID=1736264 RepID=UPI0006F833FA|nr:hypothetical protein [Methylobacterium sp. Leaf123]KQQ23707.1 hypothetical protein ASF53_05115 [Methylobacterium sp. Leaf123]
MSNVVQIHAEPEPDRAERLIDAAAQGGVGVNVHFSPVTGTSLLFSLEDGTPPAALALDAVAEISTRFKTNAAFREAVERYGFQIGAAVHAVTDPAWQTRDLTPEETAALYAGEGA